MTLEERRQVLMAMPQETLVRQVINTRYNEFIEEHATFGDASPVDPAVEGGAAYGKRIPYIGWFWRKTDFAGRRITIGHSGDFIGVMENNKWGYPERELSPEECEQVIAVIDAALTLADSTSQIDRITERINGELERLWPLFQRFPLAAGTTYAGSPTQVGDIAVVAGSGSETVEQLIVRWQR